MPEPLTAVATFGERAAVALSWIDGKGMPEGVGDPAAFGLLLEALREVEISPSLEAVLRRPRRYADGLGWADILNDEIVPHLPTKWRDGVRQRLDALLALEEVPARLVHGDLGATDEETYRRSNDASATPTTAVYACTPTHPTTSPPTSSSPAARRKGRRPSAAIVLCML